MNHLKIRVLVILIVSFISPLSFAGLNLAFKKINQEVKVVDVNYYKVDSSTSTIYLDATSSTNYGLYGPYIGAGNLTLSFSGPYGTAKPSTLVTLTLNKPIACRVDPNTGKQYGSDAIYFSTNKVTLIGFLQRSANWNDANVYYNQFKADLGINKALLAFNTGQSIFINQVIMAQGLSDDRHSYTGDFVSDPSANNRRCFLNYSDFTLLPVETPNSWINGVVVNNGGSAPANPVSTNWGFEITTAGTYEVYAHWVSNKNTVSNISYSFNGEAAVSANLDQNISSGIWVKLGVSKSFTAGSHNVTIAVDPTAFYVVDGIKVERVQ